jgi:transposase-like protein
MFLAGKNTSVLKSKTANKVHCPNCNTQNSTVVFVVGTYKHLLQIPFLAGGKFGKSVCSNCNHTLSLSEMTDTLKLNYYELKETVKTPYWHYLGIIVIKLLVIIKIFSKYY